MVAYVLIPKLAFEEHRDVLLERARKDSGYGCFQYRGDEVAVAFAYDQSAILFHIAKWRMLERAALMSDLPREVLSAPHGTAARTAVAAQHGLKVARVCRYGAATPKLFLAREAQNARITGAA
jgi:hypothetical protein